MIASWQQHFGHDKRKTNIRINILSAAFVGCFFYLAEWLLADTAFAGHQLNIMEYDVRNNILSNHKLFIYMCPTPDKSDHFRFWLKTFRNVTFSAEW